MLLFFSRLLADAVEIAGKQIHFLLVQLVRETSFQQERLSAGEPVTYCALTREHPSGVELHR